MKYLSMLSKAVNVDKGSSDVFTHIQTAHIMRWKGLDWYIPEVPSVYWEKQWTGRCWWTPKMNNKQSVSAYPLKQSDHTDMTCPITPFRPIYFIQIVQSNMRQMNTTSIHQTYSGCWQFPCQCMPAVTLCTMTNYHVEKSLRSNRQAIIKGLLSCDISTTMYKLNTHMYLIC